jgi:hypothetical protein
MDTLERKSTLVALAFDTNGQGNIFQLNARARSGHSLGGRRTPFFTCCPEKALISSRAIILASALVLAGVHFAHAQAVYPGNPGSAHAAASLACSAPPAKRAARSKIWFVDPVHGITPTAGGDGSQASPWNSLQGVLGAQWVNAPGQFPGYIRPLLASQPYRHNGVIVADNIGNPPVHPGDTILLETADYGDVELGGGPFPMTNSDWITIAPDPATNAKPIFNRLDMQAANKWIIHDIQVTGTDRFASPPTRITPLIEIADIGPKSPTDDIILYNMNVSTIDHATALTWTQAQWLANGRTGIQLNGQPGDGTNGYPTLSCISVTNSTFKDVAYGAILGANQELFSNNEISYFFNDGIDYFADGIAIQANYIHDNFETANGIHTDAMQGQNGPLGANVENHFSNILIDGNLIYRDKHVNSPFKAYLQGIVAFDEDWTHMVITNNVIISSSCYSIAVSSIHDSLIANNTGLDDGLVPTPGCAMALGGGGPSHQGGFSTDSRFVNNIAPGGLVGGPNDVNVTYDHNVAIGNFTTNPAGGQGWQHYNPGPNGTPVFGSPVGEDAFGNWNIHPAVNPATVFTAFSPTTGDYNAKPLAGNPAIGVGAAPTGEMPTKDIRGVARTAPYAAGAYGYPR